MNVLVRKPVRDLHFQVAPAARFVEAKNRNQQRARPDQEELQHFIKYRRPKPAERHVNRHRQRRHPNAEIDVPAQHNLHDLGHGEHVDATHQHGHKRKRNRGNGAGRFSKPQFQISRDRVRFGNVVKRHHHQREEQHRGNSADPVPMSRQNAVLIRRTRPAHQFQSAQIRGEKTEPRHPCRHFAAGHEKIFARVRAALAGKSRWPAPAQNRKTIMMPSTRERWTSCVGTTTAKGVVIAFLFASPLRVSYVSRKKSPSLKSPYKSAPSLRCKFINRFRMKMLTRL